MRSVTGTPFNASKYEITNKHSSIPPMPSPLPPVKPGPPGPPPTPPVPPHPPTPHPPVPPQPIGGGTFTVRPGDTLWAIAQERLGNPELFPLIEAANPQIPANGLIFPGEVLQIPQIPAPPAGATVEVVQPGDTLWGIAGGDEELVQQIAEINQLTDPSLIFPGQVLVIPPG
jgi:nucleoid-associated protein YgaU